MTSNINELPEGQDLADSKVLEVKEQDSADNKTLEVKAQDSADNKAPEQNNESSSSDDAAADSFDRDLAEILHNYVHASEVQHDIPPLQQEQQEQPAQPEQPSHEIPALQPEPLLQPDQILINQEILLLWVDEPEFREFRNIINEIQELDIFEAKTNLEQSLYDSDFRLHRLICQLRYLFNCRNMFISRSYQFFAHIQELIRDNEPLNLTSILPLRTYLHERVTRLIQDCYIPNVQHYMQIFNSLKYNREFFNEEVHSQRLRELNNILQNRIEPAQPQLPRPPGLRPANLNINVNAPRVRRRVRPNEPVSPLNVVELEQPNQPNQPNQLNQQQNQLNQQQNQDIRQRQDQEHIRVVMPFNRPQNQLNNRPNNQLNNRPRNHPFPLMMRPLANPRIRFVEDDDNDDIEDLKMYGIPTTNEIKDEEAVPMILACKICHTNLVQTVNFPCMHALYCGACARPSFEATRNCSLCRSEIMHIAKLYLQPEIIQQKRKGSSSSDEPENKACPDEPEKKVRLDK